MDRLEGHLPCLPVEAIDPEIGDHPGGTASPRAECRATLAAFGPADGGAEIEFLDELPGVLAGDDHGPACVQGDVGGAPGPRKAHFGFVVVAPHHRRVEVPVAVNLRGAQKTQIGASALQEVQERLQHREYLRRPAHEAGVSDRDRQPDGTGPEHAGLVDEVAARRMEPERELHREVGKPYPNEHGIAVPHLAARGEHHDFGRRRRARFFRHR